MDLYKSIPQKLIIHLIEILPLWFSYWILFQKGGTWVEDTLSIRNAVGTIDRRIIIFTFNIIIFFRLAYRLIFLLKRKIPWEESIRVSMMKEVFKLGIFLVTKSKNFDSYKVTKKTSEQCCQ